MTGATSKVAGKLITRALHKLHFEAQSLAFAVRLPGLERGLSLRLHALQNLAHVSEASVGSVQRKERSWGEADADEMSAMILGERRSKLDARLCRICPVHVNDNVVKRHGPYSARS